MTVSSSPFRIRRFDRARRKKMKYTHALRVAWRIAVALAVACGGMATAWGQASTGDYKLQAGDKLDVSVWKEIEMQKQPVITPDGKFTYPLAGDITAAGKSVADVRREIETRLKKYIPEPVVTVSVLAVAGNVAYVIGQVPKPGAIIMNPAMTVLQALSVAGGGTPFAKMDNIIIIRGSSEGAQRVLQFRYGQVSEGKNLQQNVILESGDVVVVP
jgi:polysaccharide biosynthesis/export protein